MTDLIGSLAKQGFVEWQTGGGCEALVRVRDGHIDVITDIDGVGLPGPNDWMFVIYQGDWMENPGCPVLTKTDSVDTALSLIDYLDAYRR